MVNAAMARACLNDRARGERPGAVSPCFQVDLQAQPSQGETEDRRGSRTPARCYGRRP